KQKRQREVRSREVRPCKGAAHPSQPHHLQLARENVLLGGGKADRVKSIDQPGIDWSVGKREPDSIQDLGGDEMPVAIGEIVEGEAPYVESAPQHCCCAPADSVGECAGGNISQ